MSRSKRIIGVILLAFTISVGWGCAKKPASNGEATATQTPYYAFQGIRAGVDWGTARSVLGDPENEIQEDATSTTYTYPHFMVMTAKQGSREIVSVIRLRNSYIETANGSIVGDSKETIIKNEGKDFVTDSIGNLIYIKEDTTLRFVLDMDGVVTAIEYGGISEE